MLLACECTLSLEFVVVPLLCLLCHSMLSDDPFVELLINQKYNYDGITHVLRKCTRLIVLAKRSVVTMERDKYV